MTHKQTKREKAIQIKYKSKKVSQKELDKMVMELDPYDNKKCEPIKGWYVQTLSETPKGTLCLCRYCANGNHVSGKTCLHCEGTGIQKHSWTQNELSSKQKSYNKLRDSKETIISKDKRYKTFGGSKV